MVRTAPAMIRKRTEDIERHDSESQSDVEGGTPKKAGEAKCFEKVYSLQIEMLA